MMTVFSQRFDGYKAQLFMSSATHRPLVYVCLYQDDSWSLLDACRKLGAQSFHLLALTDFSWDASLSPWPEGRIFSREERFLGQADQFLTNILNVVRPWALSQLKEAPVYEVIAGYSLAGLFSLYATYQTPVFSRIVSASGSLWYPHFAAYAKQHLFPKQPKAIYLSLGDRESRTRNPYFRANETISRELCQFYQHQGITSAFILNRGNHFQDNVLRLAKGITWALQL